MSDTTTHDVIVIGGGPAGSTAAALLAREGHAVTLFERAQFPRDHVGESMLPFCYRLFEDLGVVDKLKTSFVRKPGVRFLDRDGTTATNWCFSHVIDDETALSFQVNRAEFDDILLKNARRLGADVHEETTVRNVDLSDPTRAVVETVNGRGETAKHTARFLIDASGRDALVGSKNGWRSPRPELDRTALWSHWTGVEMQGGLEEGMSLIIYLGEEKKGWIWVFPLGHDRVTAGVVMQNAYMRAQRRRLEELGSTDWKSDLCMEELNQSAFVRGLLDGSQRAMPIMVNGDYSYEVKNHFGPNYAMVGDARGFIDPIFSSGVFLSIKTAYLVTTALRVHLGAGESGSLEEMKVAYDQVNGAYNFIHRMIRLFYNPHVITWAQVGEEGQVHKRHESAMATGHYMLAGDFFENYEKYNGFFDLVENPAGFRRYKKLIIDRSDFVDDSCHTSREVAFGGLAVRT